MKYKAIGITDEFDTCSCCGRQGLKRVVMIQTLDRDGNVEDYASPFGTTCAARILGYSRPTSAATKRQVETEAFKAARTEASIRFQQIRQNAIVSSANFDLEGCKTVCNVIVNEECIKIECNWRNDGIYELKQVKQLAVDRYANLHAGFPKML